MAWTWNPLWVVVKNLSSYKLSNYKKSIHLKYIQGVLLVSPYYCWWYFMFLNKKVSSLSSPCLLQAFGVSLNGTQPSGIHGCFRGGHLPADTTAVTHTINLGSLSPLALFCHQQKNCAGWDGGFPPTCFLFFSLIWHILTTCYMPSTVQGAVG